MVLLPHIVLFEPEIPANTGNVIRLCANCGAELHLIQPFGFELDDKRLRRAGLDYHEFASVKTWSGLPAYQQEHPQRRLVCVETSATMLHSNFNYESGDALVFGPETRGLPDVVIANPNNSSVRLPMLAGSRSLNLSNCVAVVVYEAWRQMGYVGGIHFDSVV